MAVTREHLARLYATTDDPWDFRCSPYEISRFAATLSALPNPHYAHALELGCGNGELAWRIAHRCDAYTGIDAVETALAAARAAVPKGRFVQAYYPCALPDGKYDLIVLSEILYFFDAPTLANLAQQLDAGWPDADVVAVTWLGPSGNALEGDAAVALLASMTKRRRVSAAAGDPRHRIDVFSPLARVAG